MCNASLCEALPTDGMVVVSGDNIMSSFRKTWLAISCGSVAVLNAI